MAMRAQSSAEFMIAIAIMGIALVPIMTAMQWNSQSSPEKMMLAKASFSADRLRSAVDSVGALGPGARLTAQVEMPQVQNISAQGREISIGLDTSFGPVDITQPTRFNVTTSGFERIRAEGRYVIDVKAGTGPDDPNVKLVLR